MRILFLGTSDFACPVLQALLDPPHELAGVVTQPDRPKGRGRKLAPPPVKLLAQSRGIAVFQPEKIREPSSLELLKSLRPELIAVAAYGQILPPALLSLPPRGCINVHASLLPKYRGAAPIVWALLNGEMKTGVTTMQMDPGMDTGPILLQAETPILPEDTAGTLHDRLARMGSELLLRTLELLEKGELTLRPQEASQATYAPRISPEDARMDWNRPARVLCNRIRAFDPWPGAHTLWRSRMLKLFRPSPAEGKSRETPGTVVRVSPPGLEIACADGLLRVGEVQLENRPRMAVAEFLRGHPFPAGEILGN